MSICIYGSNSKVIQTLAANIHEFGIALILGNDTEYGGCGGTYAFLSRHEQAPDVAYHELGHSFGNLRMNIGSLAQVNRRTKLKIPVPKPFDGKTGSIQEMLVSTNLPRIHPGTARIRTVRCEPRLLQCLQRNTD